MSLGFRLYYGSTEIDLQFLHLKIPINLPQSGFRFYFWSVGLIPNIIYPEHNLFVYVVVQHFMNMPGTTTIFVSNRRVSKTDKGYS